MFKNKSQKAFTLIELLVVMAIIAILSVIMFGPIQTARRRSKDTQAVADMKLIKSYLDLYALDHNGLYPDNLDMLRIYGNLPKRTCIWNDDMDPLPACFSSAKDFNMYNYVPTVAQQQSGIVGYQLWTHLNDYNEAFNSDADCDTTNPPDSFISCGLLGDDYLNGNLIINGKSGNDSTGDGNGSNSPNASICKDTSKCILDYANNK